jgi:uncharacterized protein YcnI
MLKSIITAAALVALGTGSAYAHITLETAEAKAGSAYKAVFRVPHGCEGSATVKISVKIPEGMFAVKPMPHAGWTIETVTGPYAKAYDNHGTALTEGVTQVSWSGGPLPDAYYDEFVLRGQLAPDLPAGMLYFPVVQECEQGTDRWIEIPAEGKTAGDYETPAPGVMVLPR